MEFLGFRNSAGTDATGTNPEPLMGFTNEDPNALKIRVPSPPGQIMGVANPVPINRAFVTDFAACHEGISFKSKAKV